MHRLLILLTVIGISGAGCAPMVMSHPTKTSIDADNYACRIEGESRASNIGAAGDPISISIYTRECLEARGWQRVR